MIVETAVQLDLLAPTAETLRSARQARPVLGLPVGACSAAGVDAELFDPGVAWHLNQIAARRYCRSCPTAAKCLASARLCGATGVYGGWLLTDAEPVDLGSVRCYCSLCESFRQVTGLPLGVSP